MARSLPENPSLESLRKQAKRLLRERPAEFAGLREAQLALAREYGFASWTELRDAVLDERAAALPARELADEFADLACLTYSELESPRRIRRAAGLLARVPRLVDASPFAAAAASDLEALRRQLDADPGRVRARGGPRGWTPLLYLTYSRIPDAPPARSALAAAELLLARGADPNDHFELNGAYRFTALTGAIGEGEQGLESQPPHPHARELALRLLDAGADPNDGQGLYNSHFTPGDHWLELLLERGLTSADTVNWSPEPMRMLDYLLCAAVTRGFEERVELLLRHGADPRAIDSYNGRSAYRNALRDGRETIAARLRAAGAPAEELGAEDRVYVACARGDLAELRHIGGERPELAANPRLLCGAAERGDLGVVGTLLDLGAKVNGTVPENTTPLHFAARAGRRDAVELLLRRGAAIAARDGSYDASPIGWANEFGHVEVRDRLLDLTRDVFDLATWARVAQLEEVLRGDPALASARRARGRTPLHRLEVGGERGAAVIDLLLRSGADIDATTDDGRTPLDVVVAVEDDEIADLLRERGAARGDQVKRSDARREGR